MFYESLRGGDGVLRLRSHGKLLTALAAVAVLVAGCFVLLDGSDGSDAEEVTVDGIIYKIDTGTATAAVTGYDVFPVSSLRP